MRQHSATCTDTLNDGLTIKALDEPSSGGASHLFVVEDSNGQECACVQFQKGPRNEDGSVSGVTHAAMIALLLQPLYDFQKGPFPSRETALLITKLEEALDLCHRRTRERAARNVLGKLEK